MSTEATAVSTDAGKDKAVSIYLGVLGLVGVGLIVATVMFDWGGYGYAGGAFLVFAGFGGLAGKSMQGGFGEAPCPSCGQALKFQFTKMARTMQCDGCGAWSEGTETMALVPNERIADFPVFTTPMPEAGIAWPLGADQTPICPMCDRAATGFRKIEGSDALGATAALVAPVSVRKVHSIEVPICSDHDGVALLVAGSELKLGFRSRSYQLRFEADN
ncbi:MAG: hypothetical protein GXP55_02430 [Deltaproteobacteria bacterium]|nr:hypothetical protein [Deltaproteobacteria bacterium]